VGERAAAGSGRTYTVVNPATGETVEEVPNGGAADVDRAARSAAQAQRAWARLAAGERAPILHRAAAHMLTKIEEIAPVLTADQGKTILESRIEAQRFGENIAWFADLADKVHGEHVSPRREPSLRGRARRARHPLLGGAHPPLRARPGRRPRPGGAAGRRLSRQRGRRVRRRRLEPLAGGPRPGRRPPLQARPGEGNAGLGLPRGRDEGVAIRDMAQVIGRKLQLPVGPVAADRLGFLGPILNVDQPASSAHTREVLGWAPTHPGLLADLEAGFYTA
jgi:hypothetical protein